MPLHKLKFKELIILSLRNFRTKPQRAIMTILGMAVGIATVLLLVSLGYGFQYILIGKLITTEDSLITMEVSYPTESNIVIKQETIDKLKTSADVAEVSPVAEFPGEARVEGATGGLLVNTLVVEPAYFRLSGTLPDIGKIPTDIDKGLVSTSQLLGAISMPTNSDSLGKLLNFKIYYQDPVTLVSDEADSIAPIPITGIVTDDSSAPTATLFASSLTKQPPFYSKALVKAQSIDVIEKLRDTLLGQGFQVNARIDLVNQARKITNIITIVLGVFGITALIVSAIGMFNTMLVGFLERIYEVGILKSLGATDSDVRGMFLVEASIMGFLGGASGIIMGLSLGAVLNSSLSFVAKRFGGKSINLFVSPIWFILLILAFSVFIGFISGWWPARSAARLSPKEAFTRK
jgi:putative ABC transport system permease protein